MAAAKALCSLPLRLAPRWRLVDARCAGVHFTALQSWDVVIAMWKPAAATKSGALTRRSSSNGSV